MFQQLESINERPAPFSHYTAAELWNDEHTSGRMLAYHLAEDLDLSSRNHAFIERSAAWIAEEFGAAEGVGIVDFGCGPGLYAQRLARRGARVTGIDFSTRSIAYAREAAAREGLDVEYVERNYLEFGTDGRFDLAMMIMCDFCALGPEQRRSLLAVFRDVLKPGGRVLLDVYSPSAYAKREEAAVYEKNQLAGFWSPDPYYGFVNTFKYEREKVVLDKYVIVEAERTRTVYNWLQYFAPDDLRGEFVAAGFEVATLLGDVAGSPFDEAADEYAIVARKP